MQDNSFDVQNIYWIGGRAYTREECEAVYLFWKGILEEAEIKGLIYSALECAGDRDRKFNRWVEANIDECVEAVSQDVQQGEFFQNILHQDGHDKMSTISSVEDCLRDLFICSIESAS